LSGADPCRIPEKELKKEQQRKKKGLVFSGANVTLQVECGASTRIIRTDLLDRDLFAANPNPPAHISWTTQLLERLDKTAGPTPVDKPAFPLLQPPGAATVLIDPQVQQNLTSGKYDELFAGAPDRASEVYKASQIEPPKPTVRLTSSTPIQPGIASLPAYPPIARMAQHEGSATVHLSIDGEGNVSTILDYEGSKLFEGAVSDAVKRWKFPVNPDVKEVIASIELKLNCRIDSHSAPKP
jgi:TonB family protein